MDTAISLAEALRPAFAKHGVGLALLFGSRARGTHTPGSDLDVAVDADALDVLGLILGLSDATGLEVDVVDLRRAGYPLLSALLRDAVVLYEGEPYAGARWRTRAILQTELDRPWFERMRDAYLAKLAAGGAHG